MLVPEGFDFLCFVSVFISKEYTAFRAGQNSEFQLHGKCLYFKTWFYSELKIFFDAKFLPISEQLYFTVP